MPPTSSPDGAKPHLPYKTRQSLAEVTAHLRARYLEEKRRKQEQLLFNQFRAAEQRVREGSAIPTRKASKASRNTYGQNTFQTCPGGARDEAKTGAYAAFLKQVEHPETGCIVIQPETAKGQATLQRLAHSSLNANTTQGNYSHSVLHK